MERNVMEFVHEVSRKLAQLTTEQMMLCLIALCLLLVVMMGLSLLILHKRTKRAEEQVKTLSDGVGQQLAAAEAITRENRETSKREMNEAMQQVNDSMLHMMGEITRTQQGQIEALGGQLRAAGRQEEERMERIRQTMDRRLGAYEERLGGVSQTLDVKLAGNEERMERMRETIEGGLQRIRDDNQTQLEQMRLTVDEKLNATVDQRLEASFAAVTRRL